MGTYNKAYKLDWLNLNLPNKTITLKYNEVITLDDGKVITNDIPVLELSSQAFDSLYSIPITALTKEATIGETMVYLCECAFKTLRDSSLEITPELFAKFANSGTDLFIPQANQGA